MDNPVEGGGVAPGVSYFPQPAPTDPFMGQQMSSMPEPNISNTTSGMILGNLSVPPEDLTNFYPLISEIVTTGNITTPDFLLLREYFKEVECDFLAAIPLRYHRLHFDAIPLNYREAAIKDINFKLDMLKIAQLIQLSKARDGFMTKQLTNSTRISKFEDLSDQRRGGGLLGFFKR